LRRSAPSNVANSRGRRLRCFAACRLRQGRAVARALLVAIDQAAQRRAVPPHDPVFARAVQEVREAGVSDDLVGFVLEARNRHPLT